MALCERERKIRNFLKEDVKDREGRIVTIAVGPLRMVKIPIGTFLDNNPVKIRTKEVDMKSINRKTKFRKANF